MTPYLSIIIPAYNEELRLQRTLPKLKAFLKEQSFSWEVVFVDDGSTDRTAQTVSKFFKEEPCQVLINEKNYGKGFATRRGVIESKGEMLMKDSNPRDYSFRRGWDKAHGSVMLQILNH